MPDTPSKLLRSLANPALLALVLLLTFWGVARGLAGPEPRTAVAAGQFSAAQADKILRDLLREGDPHPAGSAANAVVRDRLLAHFQAAGYQPQVQKTVHCEPLWGACAPVENVFVRKAGSGDGAAILLTAHYDSGWAGAGAGDDGAAVAAILEIARLIANDSYRNDIYFLITDAEELGLIGADAFVSRHPLWPHVQLVINLEARGGAGASAMFETGDGNAAMIATLAQALPNPVANSLTYEIYKRMPNDTDYSVYKRRGVMGVNFAFTAAVARYHSARDDLYLLDRRSLQHHGDNALAVLNAVADIDLASLQAAGDAAYIDLFGVSLLYLPATWMLPLVLLLSLLTIAGIVWIATPGSFAKPWLWGIRLWVALLLGLPSIAWLLSWPMGRWLDLHALGHPTPWAGRVALIAIAAWWLTLLCRWGRNWTTPAVLLCYCWGTLVLLGVVLTALLPAAGYLLLLPLTLFVLGLAFDARWHRGLGFTPVAAALGFLGASYIAVYHFLASDVVLNFDQAQLKMLPIVLCALAALPLISWHYRHTETDKLPERAAFLLFLLALGTHIAEPGFTPEEPRDMALEYREVAGDAGATLILRSYQSSGDTAFARHHGFQQQMLPGRRGVDSEGWAKSVELRQLPPLQASAPVKTVVGEDIHYGLELTPPADYRQLYLSVPLDVELREIRVNGQLALDPQLPNRRPRERYTVRLSHLGSAPIRIEILTGSAAAFSAELGYWTDMPPGILAPYWLDWPDNARPAFYPHRMMWSAALSFGG